MYGSHNKIYSENRTNVSILPPVKGECCMSAIDKYIMEIIHLVENCKDADLLDLVYKLLLSEG